MHSQRSSVLPLLAHWCVSVHLWIAPKAPYITSPTCTRMCIQHAHARGKEMGTHLFPSRLDGAVRQTSCYPWEHFFSDLSFLVKDVLSLLHQLMASSDGCWKTCYLLLCTGLTSRLAGITAGSRRLTGEQRINPKCRHLRQSRSGSKI